MNQEKLYQRREAAKKLGITVPQLKELEAEGVAQPIRDGQRRFRYTADQLRDLARVMKAEASSVQNGEPMPEITQEAQLPAPLPSAPEMGAIFSRFLRDEAAREGLSIVQLLQHYAANPSTFAPPSFVPILRKWEVGGMGSVQGIWSDLIGGVIDEIGIRREFAPPAAPQVPPVARKWIPSTARRSSPRTATYPHQQGNHWAPGIPVPQPYGYPAQYPPVQTGPVQEARNDLEIDRIGFERQRLAQQMETEGRVARETSEAQRQHAIQMEQARIYAAQTAVVEEQRRREIEQIAAQQRANLATAESIRAQYETDEKYRQQLEQQEAERRVAETHDKLATRIADLIAGMPPEMGLDERAQLQEMISEAIDGQPYDAAKTIAETYASQARAPYEAALRSRELRDEAHRNLFMLEVGLFYAVPAEVVAVADQVVTEYLASTDIDDSNYQRVLVEARSLRDQVFQEAQEPNQEEEQSQATDLDDAEDETDVN